MDVPTTLEMNVQARSNVRTQRRLNTLRKFPALSEISAVIKSDRSSKGSSVKASFRLGEVVYHGSFGCGQVKALWPDGRVLVKFDCANKNQLIFPSFLS